MKTDNTVTLTIGGTDYAGWKSVRIEAGIERAARSFEVEVTDRFPGDATPMRSILPGDRVEVRIGSDLVCTGYVDARPIEYDATGYNIRVVGRSLTADLVDSSADNDGGQWLNQTPAHIIQALAQQYGIAVVTQAAQGDPITDHQIVQGETVFESMDRVAQARQILITDDENGRLVLASAGSAGKAGTALVLGENIMTGACGYDYSEVYGEYIVKGQKSGDDDLFGEGVAQSQGKASDHTITRRRTIIIRQQGQADNKTAGERAAYEAKLRHAKAQEARYTVAGWRQGDGTLWRHNQLVRISDDLIGIEGEWVITETNYTLDRMGKVTELVVLPPEALQAAAEIKAEEAKNKVNPNDDGLDWGNFAE